MMRLAGNQVITASSKQDLETLMRDFTSDLAERLGISEDSTPTGEWEIDLMFDASYRRTTF